MPDRIVKVVLRGDVAGFTASMASAKASVVSTTSAMTAGTKDAEKYRAGLTTLGSQAGKFGLVAAAGLGVATKAAMDWETAWAGVTKTVNGSDEELAALEVGLRNLAKTLPATHEEIAGVAEAAGQLGVATGDILSFTKTMIDLGETTNLSADEAATSIAQMANVMGTSADDIDNFGAALVALGNDGASTEAGILAMATRLSGAGKLVGATEADVLALANAMSSMGIEAELGGGAMSRTMLKIYSATKSGGEELQGFARIAGMSGQAFQEAFGQDPIRAVDAFVQGLNRIDESGGNAVAALGDLGIEGSHDLSVLLRLKGAQDLLSDSLDLGAQAWEENTALTDEAGKRYETTASKAQVAVNGIRDDLIELGDVALPVVAEIADGVTRITGVFGQLPGPVKSVTTSLLAVTAITGGSLWFGSKVVNSVASTRKALDQLGISSGTTTTRLGRIGRTAGGILAVATAVNILGRALDGSVGNNVNVGNLNRELDSLATRGVGDLDVVADSLHGLEEAGAGVANAIFKIPGAIVGVRTSFERNKDVVAAYDEQLAQLVESGRGKEAQRIFELIGEAARGQGVSVEETESHFKQYALALDNAAAKGKEAGKESGRTAEEVKRLAANAGVAAEQIRKMSDEERASAIAAGEVGREFFNLGKHVDNADVSFKDWIRSLELQTKALEDFTENAKTAAKKGLGEGLIAELEAAGPAGALRMRQLANGTKAEIKRANEAWRAGQNAIDEYVAMVVPPKDIEVNTTPAETELNALTGLLDSMLGGITIPVKVATSGTDLIEQHFGFNNGPGQADGGTIAGARYPYGDKVLTPTAPGEFVMSNRYGQADKNRAALEAGNRGATLKVVGGMADGGSVGFADGGSVAGRSYAAAPGVTVYFPTPAQMASAVKSANLVAAANAAAAGSAARMAAYTAATARSGTQIRDQHLEDLNAQRRIRDIKRDLAARDDKGRLELRGLDRTIAKAELDQARRELTAIRNQVKAAKAEAQRERERARKEARDEGIRALKEQRTDVKNTLKGTADIFARGVRPAGAVAEVNRQIADISEYGTVIARLKGAGASPALLSQVVAKAESGDFRSAIRLGQALLAQPATLSQLNSALGTLGQVSAAVAGVTTDPRFLAAGSWNPGSTSITKTVNVNIGADPSMWKLEFQRYIQHTVSEQLAAAGV